jgi:hypothetical protein
MRAQVQADPASSSAGELFLRRVAEVSDRQEPARTNGSRLRGEPVLVSAAGARRTYFGWFGSFMAFTGANLLQLLQGGAGALLVGMCVVTATRARRRANAIL